MIRKLMVSAAMAAALGLAGTPASAQPDHERHHPDQPAADDSRDMNMMSGMSDGGMMGHMMGGQNGKMGGCMMDGGMMGGGMMKLDAGSLSERQQEQLAALHGRQAEEHFMLMMRMKAARQELRSLTGGESSDMGAVEQAYDRLAEIRKEMFLSHLRARQQMQEITGSQGSSAP